MKTLCLCMPVHPSDLKEIGVNICDPVLGSIRDKCSNCGIDVWVGPRSSAIKDTLTVICVKCGVLKTEEMGDFTIETLGGGGAHIVLDDGREFSSHERN